MYIIDKSTEDQQIISQRIPFAALRELLTDAEIETICKQLGHTWRERRLPTDTRIFSPLLQPPGCRGRGYLVLE
ncbi:hypothetical protein ACFL5Z_00360 [Planctomycetota bacterium]